LNGDKKIIVCTIQTFPALYERMTELVKKSGRRYAVIADEAHSSQAGESASKLKQVLGAEEEEEKELSTEDLLVARATSRVEADKGITFIAFIATPKPKTLELFGTRPRPAEPPASDNVPEAFDVYSMRQAIEEKFILDVLQNYITYSLAFRLQSQGKEYDEKQVERSTALKGIFRCVKLHPCSFVRPRPVF
jgi:type I restriction enzyme R subunit